MPSKKAKTSTCNCDLCCKPIIEGKDEALGCEGECGKWFHRDCAGISMTHFKWLSTTTTPFVCFPCNQLAQEAKVSQLLSEIERLKSQLLQLEEKLEESQGNGQPGQGGAIDQQWSHVVKKRAKNATGKRPAPAKVHEKQKKRPHPQEPLQSDISPTNLARPKTAALRQNVSGARRVWGTLRSATHNTVRNTIVHLTKCESNAVQVKRKSKTSRSGKLKWWFVLHGEECTLVSIESDWEKVSLQTGWRLEKCTKPVDSLALPNADIVDHDTDTPTQEGEILSTCSPEPKSGGHIEANNVHKSSSNVDTPTALLSNSEALNAVSTALSKNNESRNESQNESDPFLGSPHH